MRGNHGSSGKSAGTWVYGLAWWAATMRPYTAYESTSLDPTGGATMAMAAPATATESTARRVRVPPRAPTSTMAPPANATVNSTTVRPAGAPVPGTVTAAVAMAVTARNTHVRGLAPRGPTP